MRLPLRRLPLPRLPLPRLPLPRRPLAARPLGAGLVGALLLLSALGAGCGPSGLDVEVNFPTDLGIDQLVFAFAAGDAEPIAGVAAPEEPAPAPLASGVESAVFFLPDDMVGKDVTVVVDGANSGLGRAVASASATVASRGGVLVPLTVTLESVLGCGNGFVDTLGGAAEVCDDGNTADGDGCSAACALEGDGFACDVDVEPTSCAPICADGLVRGAEQCDDGGLAADDGCAADCTVEDGWSCAAAGAGAASVCTPVCGDGLVRGLEQCDDENIGDGDGCSIACAIEAGWLCDGAAPTTCTEVCGDGLRVGAEGCDDGDVDAGDGCAPGCTEEPGATCDEPAPDQPSVCAGTCGDGFLILGEPCDDAGVVDGDGCSAQCAIEPGWLCDGLAPTTCDAVCGDGLVRDVEGCDDGDLDAGDGCAADCTEEPGATCVEAAPDQPSVCAGTCGDGFLILGEPCDDGGVVDGDGCSALCALEQGWLCDGLAPTSCTPICGDGIALLAGGVEGCDDGGIAPGDGCAADCTVETGFACDAASPSVCAPVCGDQLVLGGEECDDGPDPTTGNSDTRPNACRTDCTSPVCGDGVADDLFGEGCEDLNTDNGDACHTACLLPACGDGLRDAGEQCDDGGAVDGDGCSAACTVEVGSECGGAPSVCVLAGDGFTVAPSGGQFTSIQAAHDNGAVASGDTLFVAAGTYNGRIDIDAKNLTIVGDGGVVVLTDNANGSGETLRIRSGRVVTFQGVRVENLSTNARSPVLVEGTATFRGCTIGRSRSIGVRGAGGSTVTLARTLVDDNDEGGADLAGAFTVENSVFRGNGAAGSAIGGVRLVGTGSFRFNTVVANLSNAGAGVDCAAGADVLERSVIVGNAGAAGGTAGNCDASTSITADPGLDPADGFHLDVGSSARDVDVTCPLALDFDGDPRPINGACDAGADERP